MTTDIHDEVAHLIRFFEWIHLPPDLQKVSQSFQGLAESLVFPEACNRETIAGLRKLLEAKDCYVRAKLAQVGGIRAETPESE